MQHWWHYTDSKKTEILQKGTVPVYKNLQNANTFVFQISATCFGLTSHLQGNRSKYYWKVSLKIADMSATCMRNRIINAFIKFLFFVGRIITWNWRTKGKFITKKNFPHLQFVHHESHIDQHGIEPGPPPEQREMCVNRTSAPTSQRTHWICFTRSNPLLLFREIFITHFVNPMKYMYIYEAKCWGVTDERSHWY
jgi:hypothetical protein